MTPPLIGPGSVRYSSIRASNGKWMLIQGESGFNVLYTIAGFAVRTLPAALSQSAQVVFDRRDSNLLLYVAGNALMLYDVVADKHDTLHVFAEYSRISSTHAEGDLSESDCLSLCGIKPYGLAEVFLFNTRTCSASKRYPQSGQFDGINAVGSHLILSKDSGIYDLTAGTQLTTANGHACPARYNGRDVLLWCNSNENPITLPDYPNAVVLVDLQTGEQTGLKSFPWAYAMHVSAGPDFAVVSVYDPTGVLPFQIWRVPFDGSGSTMVHSWSSLYNADYQPRATYNDGLILFNAWDGRECHVMGLKLEPAQAEGETRIDYSQFMGLEFVMRPRADGAIDIYERKARKGVRL